MSRLRAILALSRLSGLPTIFSNCLAGWWLGGGGNARNLPLLFGGATLAWLGSAFLHDAFDIDFDRAHRRGRPVPSGAIGLRTVWRWGLGLTAMGALLWLLPGTTCGSLGLGFVLVMVLHNALHRVAPFAPVLPGICRFFLYAIGASVAEHGVTGWALWCGLALAAYIAGIQYFARWKTDAARAQYWPAALLAVPILLALLMNADKYREPALLLSAVVLLWSVRCLRQTFWSPERNVGSMLDGLTAGIVFVDWLAACPAAVSGQGGDSLRPLSIAFIALFGIALLARRVELPRMGD